MENKDKTTFENQGAQSKFVDKRMSNVKSDLIEITHDKLENILLKHLKNLDIRNSWITPASIFLTVLIVRLTATFNDSFGISKDVWNAFFLILMFGSLIWLIWKIIEIINCWKKSSVEYLINSIKASETNK